MCQYQTLYHDDRIGYVVRCTECEKTQVGYGNLVITFSEEDLESFRWWIKKLRDENQSTGNDRVRNIVIPTPCEGIRLRMSVQELRDFYSMLDIADSEMRSLQIMKLFD